MLNYSPTPRLPSLSCESTRGLLEGYFQDHPSMSLLPGAEIVPICTGICRQGSKATQAKTTQHMAEPESYKAWGLA